MKTSRTEQTIKAYDQNAQKYAAKFTEYAIYTNKVLDFQRKHIAKGAQLLDLGCGPGQNITTLLECDDSIRATGIDLSEEFVRIASLNNPTASFLQADVCSLTPNHQYDVILASFCIVHLDHEETGKLINFIARSLSDNGRLYLSFMEGAGSGFEATSFSDEKIFFNYYQYTEIEHLLQANGMKVLEKQTEDYLEPDGTTTTDVFVYAAKAGC